MAAAHERGLELPADLSIVGFDDAPISRYVYPKLTTVHYPIADMARMASRWVLKHVYDQQRSRRAAGIRAQARRARLRRPPCVTLATPPSRDRNHPDRRAQRFSHGLRRLAVHRRRRFHRSRIRAERVRARLGRHVDGRRCHGIHFHLRSTRRSIRPAHGAAPRHLCVRGVGIARGAVGKFRDADRRAAAQRLRRRRCAGHRAHVHRGDLAVRVARPHGVLQPVVHRAGTAGRLRQQLLHRASRRRRRVELALDARASAWCRRYLISSHCWWFRRARAGWRCTASCPRRAACSRASRAASAPTRELEAVLDIARARSAARETRARGNPESGAARRAHHRAAGRHPAADHRHQLGAVVRRRDLRTRRRRRQCVLHADRVRGPRERRVHGAGAACSSIVSAAGPC